MRKNKLLTILLAGILLFSVVGCDTTAPKPEPKPTYPTYEDDKTMLIGAWNAPRPTKEAYQTFKDSGLNTVWLDPAFGVGWGTPLQAQVFEWCEELGLDVIVNPVQNAWRNENPFTDPTDYRPFKAVKGFNYWDEPHAAALPWLEAQAAAHNDFYGEQVKYIVNHYPSIFTMNIHDMPYREFMEAYCRDVLGKITTGEKMLSVDLYPFNYAKGQGENGSQMRDNWLQNLEITAELAQKYFAEQHYFIQTTTHLNYRPMSEADLRMQFYTCMAYGVKGISYFTYNTSNNDEGPWRESFVNYDTQEPLPLYYAAQKVNQEMLAFDHVYLSYEWVGTMPVGTSFNFLSLSHPLRKIEGIKKVTSTQAAIIGDFVDEDGNQGLMAVNFTDPYEKKDNKVVIEFENSTHALVYYRGEERKLALDNHKLTLDLEAGDGAFIIPVTEK